MSATAVVLTWTTLVEEQHSVTVELAALPEEIRERLLHPPVTLIERADVQADLYDELPGRETGDGGSLVESSVTDRTNLTTTLV